MASIMQQLRRMSGTTTGAPDETGRKEGELFIDFIPANGGGKAKLWAYGGPGPTGVGWTQLNSDLTINVVSKSIPGTTTPEADGNAVPAGTTGWPWVVKAGEVPIVTHNGRAYAFTGVSGSWGTTSGGHKLSLGQFTPLGATPGKPEVHDLSGITATDLGDAYTKSGLTFGTGLIVVKWKDGKTYILKDPANPGDAVSYEPVASSSPDQPIKLLDWTGSAYAGDAKITDAYNTWATTPPGNSFDTKDITLVKYGKTNDTYIVIKPGSPTTSSSYLLLHHPAEALAFTATYDITVAYDSSTMKPAHAGDFGLISKDGMLISTPGNQWPINGASPGTSTFKQGDMLIWDGNQFFALPNETDLSAYLKLSGGSMAEAAEVTFKVPATGGLVTRIDGGKAAQSALDNFTIDAGKWT